LCHWLAHPPFSKFLKSASRKSVCIQFLCITPPPPVVGRARQPGRSHLPRERVMPQPTELNAAQRPMCKARPTGRAPLPPSSSPGREGRELFGGDPCFPCTDPKLSWPASRR
jgi:hypothetical protein